MPTVEVHSANKVRTARALDDVIQLEHISKQGKITDPFQGIERGRRLVGSGLPFDVHGRVFMFRARYGQFNIGINGQ